MSVKTTLIPKFQHGDLVWTMSDNKPVQAPITAVSTFSSYKVIEITYFLNDQPSAGKKTEKELFNTKEELLSSL